MKALQTLFFARRYLSAASSPALRTLALDMVREAEAACDRELCRLAEVYS